MWQKVYEQGSPFVSGFIIWLLFTTFFLTRIALGADEKNLAESLQSDVKQIINQINNDGLEDEFVSDGSPIRLESKGLTVVPPAGWQVQTNRPSLTLFMQEPKPEKIEYNKPIYQRNITVAVINKPAPMDKVRLESFKNELQEIYAKRGGISDWQLLSADFFDYRQDTKGILAYSSYRIGEFQLMQMHVLLSGSERQALLTYTDLADRFQGEDSFQKAWQSMVSTELHGVPPVRFQSLAIIGSSLTLLLGLMIWGLRRRRKKALEAYRAAADSVYEDVPISWNPDKVMTQSLVWNLDQPEDESGLKDEVIGLSFYSTISR